MERNYIQVSALNNYIKLWMDDNTFLRKVYVKGEISNFKNHMSGHLYFTLKDEESRISAIMFRGKTIDLKFTPEDGKKVLIEGRVSCYPSQGTYQIYVDKMEEDGLGNLYILYEELKKKLASEGLFREEKKKRIPKYPTRIGIVTAPKGAAIKDILSTIKRRYPICETILFPALVQGKSAAPDIVRQIKNAEKEDIDVLIVGRGGGSIEDLWAFNEEIVARAIYECKIPVISAVGHEIDYTIADFVADLRAPTPTGAAELATPTMDEVKKTIAKWNMQVNHIISTKIIACQNRFEQIKNTYILKNPAMLYEVKMQKLDYLNEKINQKIQEYLNQKNMLFQGIKNAYILKNPHDLYKHYEEKQKLLEKDLNRLIKYTLEKNTEHLKMTINTLKLVNPLNILEKGYSIVTKKEKVIKQSKELKPKDKISIRLKEGSILASVEEVK